MKSPISKLTACFVAFLFLLSACSKDKILDNPQPIPQNNKPADTVSFRFAIAVSLSGEPYHSSNLTAVVSIVNEKNEDVITDKSLLLDLNNIVKTEPIKLPAGTYKLTRLRLVYGGVYTHFAAPMATTAKASLVQKPLAMTFQITKTGNNEIPVEVVRVNKGERPEVFGYPKGSFDNNQSENDPFLKVKLRAIMKIGQITYDSIPTSLRVTTWNSNGEMTTGYSQLKAGVNEISVLKAGVKFAFQVTKWGTAYELTLDRQNINEENVYTLGGAKEAKLLKSELTYKLVDGSYKAESKTEYVYNAANKLSKINYYLKRKDNSAYLALVDVFEYKDTNVQVIRRYDEANKMIGITSFGYDQQGKLHSISQNENGEQTNATVEYFYYTHEEIKIHYAYSGKTYNMDSYLLFYGGNILNSTAVTSYGSNETGRYDHDFEINPYAHMNWPNLFLSNSSKNNKISQYKTYNGNYPAAEPYSFSFTYDGEGYPTEQIKKFRSYLSTDHLYTTKTVYVY